MTERSAVLDGWQRLREGGRLGTLLPQCVDRCWGEGAEAAGFVTTDYRIYRDFPLPADRGGATLPANLIEIYWSVRTRGGRQDPNWAAALNAHVVQIVEEPVSAGHLDHLYRLAVTLRKALQLGAIGPLLAEAKPVALHVRGLLLGHASDTEIVDRMASHADLPLAIGRYQVGADGTISFSGGATETGLWETAGNDEDLRALGRRLVQHDALFQTAGAWAPDPGGDWNDDGTERPPRGRRSDPR